MASSESLNLNRKAALLSGVVLELLHFTSLIHDDVIDEHEFRRGYPTLNKTFARNQAVLIGDFMMCEVIKHSLTGKYSNRIIELFVEAVQKLVAGVIMEQNVLSSEPTLDKYIEMVACKTSSLFRLSLGLPFVTNQHFSKAVLCGENFGLLFQIYDDYLDRHSDKSYENVPSLKIRKLLLAMLIIASSALLCKYACEYKRLHSILLVRSPIRIHYCLGAEINHHWRCPSPKMEKFRRSGIAWPPDKAIKQSLIGSKAFVANP